MDPLDIIAQWRRDIATADNAGHDGAQSRLRGAWPASAGADAQDGPAAENDGSSRRTGTTDKS
ncbi:hypothetical protein [Nocardia sp. NPDC058633]|uniref:hypothetical protein n=1 Tax=Nocardia sp. NPDC058633 TaxID=3346568 RepID=UPI0036644447